MMSPSPSVISPDSVQLSSKRPRSPTVIQPSGWSSQAPATSSKAPPASGRSPRTSNAPLTASARSRPSSRWARTTPRSRSRHDDGFATGFAFVGGRAGARPLIISQSGPASEVQRCVCACRRRRRSARAWRMLFFGCPLRSSALVQLCRGWLWCDGPQGCGVQRCEVASACSGGSPAITRDAKWLSPAQRAYRRKMACIELAIVRL